MTLDELLKADNKHIRTAPREDHIRATIQASRASFVRAESEMPLSRTVFLRTQLALIRKRWWLAQALLLALMALTLPNLAELQLVARSLGVAASLFVILVIPEIARNSTANAMEVEGTTHYTLRHIYAARTLCFGGVDLLILTGFCCTLSWTMQLSLITLITQFLLPLVVTAILCFGVLSSQRGASQRIAICTCLFWGGLWWLLLLNERLYAAISTPVWLGLFAISLVFLCFTIRHWIATSTKQWEVNQHGTLYE